MKVAQLNFFMVFSLLDQLILLFISPINTSIIKNTKLDEVINSIVKDKRWSRTPVGKKLIHN